MYEYTKLLNLNKNCIKRIKKFVYKCLTCTHEFFTTINCMVGYNLDARLLVTMTERLVL